jgi:hypothetical protein
MNLVCPHCQKMVTVPEQQAGHMTSCPSCEQKFLVPSLPQPQDDLPKFDLPTDVPLVPLPPSEPTRPHTPEPAEHEGGVYKVASEPSRPPPLYESRREERAAAAPPRAASAAPAAMPRATHQPPPVTAPSGTSEGYEHTTTFTLNPRVLPIMALVALGLLFFLLFFSWAGAFPGGYSVYTQNWWQMLVGSYSYDPVGQEALGGKQPFETDGIGANPLMWFYLLFFLASLVLAIAPLVLQKTTFKLPPALQDLWPWRQAILAGALLLTFLILILQGSVGFGLETAIRRQVEKSLESEREAAKTPETLEKVAIKEGAELGRFNIHRTTAFRLAFLLNFVALACVGLELWLSRRASKPLPRMDLYW